MYDFFFISFSLAQILFFVLCPHPEVSEPMGIEREVSPVENVSNITSAMNMRPVVRTFFANTVDTDQRNMR